MNRLRGLCLLANVVVMTSRNCGRLVEKHLSDLPADQLLGEPGGRNPAPCIAYASYRAQQCSIKTPQGLDGRAR